MELALQLMCHEHYARIIIKDDGSYLVCWKIPGTKPNTGRKTFNKAAEAIGTYTLYENLIAKYYENNL